ncbi:mannose-1-phosphate guanyltransferase [Coelomomyces lativittatus]|nr:mannose-1-phosphate guanyltransferase [Coelomomyces lativittatus]KAJ1504817.1 mannose-1-phosphate guanyltransferase [Coelomomyces lativittatus]
MMVKQLEPYEKELNITITFSEETEPLGTAGPLALARDILGKDDSPFFVLNSDVICEFPFNPLLNFHRSHGGEGTIMVTKVEEPSKYGVVVMHEQHPSQILKFVEKPTLFVSNRINAGLYIFNPSMLNRIELRPTSIEKETFPAMVKDTQLHAMDLEGFWMDVGQPKDFLSGIGLYLSSLHRLFPTQLAQGPQFVGHVLMAPGVQLGEGCLIGPNVTIDENVKIGDGVRIKNAVIMKNCIIQNYSWIEKTIVGWNSNIGQWNRLEGVSVLGDDVSTRDEIYMNGGCILPHKHILQCIPEPQIIM